MNPFAELGEKIAKIKGWDDDSVEVGDTGFTMRIDPLEHDEEDYKKLAEIFPNLAPDILAYSKGEAQGILTEVNKWLRDNNLPEQGLTDGLDDTRGAISDAFSALDEIGKDNSEYPDYSPYIFKVENTGPLMTKFDFNGCEKSVINVIREPVAKMIDDSYVRSDAYYKAHPQGEEKAEKKPGVKM